MEKGIVDEHDSEKECSEEPRSNKSAEALGEIGEREPEPVEQ
jgi:hypothetical protein